MKKIVMIVAPTGFGDEESLEPKAVLENWQSDTTF